MSFAREFTQGLSAALDGFRYLCRYPLLWRFGVGPVLVNIVVGLIAWMMVFQTARTMWDEFTTSLPVAWYAPIVEWIGFVAIVLLSLAAGLISYLLLQSVFCSWFFSLLARRVEEHLGPPGLELTDLSIPAQVRDALRATLKLLILNAFVLVLHLIPVVGSIAAMSLGLYVSAFILGSEFMGYPQELRGTRWLVRQEFAKRHRGATLGLGAVVSGLMLIPIVGAALQATSVVGAVLLHRRLTAQPDAPPQGTAEF